MLYPFKTPGIFRLLFPYMVWQKNDAKLYLTFDDGPHPEITLWVLEELKKHNIKATFFCVGDNVVKYPEVINKMKEEGHCIANHTYNHLNGWKTSTEDYLSNIEKTNKVIETPLFRPPYGRLKRSQRKKLQNYQIIQWSLLSGDFDPSLNKTKALKKLCNGVKPGSIIVFHDSKKAQENLEFLLPAFLDYCGQQNFKFGLF